MSGTSLCALRPVQASRTRAIPRLCAGGGRNEAACQRRVRGVVAALRGLRVVRARLYLSTRWADVMVPALRGGLRVHGWDDSPGFQAQRSARVRAVVLMGAVCRWVRSNDLGDYCQFTGLYVWPRSRCMANPKVRVSSCYGDLLCECDGCGLYGEACPGRGYEPGVMRGGCPFRVTAPLPSRACGSDSGVVGGSDE